MYVGCYVIEALRQSISHLSSTLSANGTALDGSSLAKFSPTSTIAVLLDALVIVLTLISLMGGLMKALNMVVPRLVHSRNKSN